MSQQTRLTLVERRLPRAGCHCLGALHILRDYLAYGSMEEARSAPVCSSCGRSPLESAAGYPVKLYLGLDTERV